MTTGSVMPVFLLIASSFINPVLGLVVLGGSVATVVAAIRADVHVRKEAWNTITKDIDDGKLSDRYAKDVLDMRATELEQARARLPGKGRPYPGFLPRPT